MRQLGVMALILVLASCASSDKRPDWLDGTSKQYPSQHYVVGTGVSLNLDDAKNRARADLAKGFEVAVSEHSKDTQQYMQSVAGEESASSSIQRIQRDVTTHTDKVLRGVEIADTWEDEKGRYHVLAVLSKGRAQQALRSEISELDKATEVYIDKAALETDKLRKVALASQALQAQLARAGVQRSLQVVDKSGYGTAPRWSLAKLETDLVEQLGRIRIGLEADSGLPEGLEAALRGALGESGFKLDDKSSDYRLQASLKQESLGKRDGWYWIKATLRIDLIDSRGKSRGSHRWSLKEAATTEALAQQRLANKLAKQLRREMHDTLLGFAF